MNTKYLKQNTDYTCLIACFRNIINEDISEKDLIEKCHSHESYGTLPADLIAVGKELGYTIQLFENATFEQMEKDAETQAVIILFTIDTPHSVLYISSDRENINTYDPYLDTIRVINKKSFISPLQKHPDARWATDLASLIKYYPNEMDVEKVRSYTGKRQYMTVKKWE